MLAPTHDLHRMLLSVKTQLHMWDMLPHSVPGKFMLFSMVRHV